MTLPPELDRVFDVEIRRYGAENAMPYLTTIERFAELRTIRAAIVEVLEVRFGAVPEALIEQLEVQTDVNQLKHLHRQAILIPAIADFLALLPAPPAPQQ